MAARRVQPSPYISVAGTQDADRFTPADPEKLTFYRELRPISAESVPEALAVSGLDRQRLGHEGAEPGLALAEFTGWVREVAVGAQPVMCGYPASYVPREPLSRRHHPLPDSRLRSTRGTPIALDDAIEQAGLFANLKVWAGSSE